MTVEVRSDIKESGDTVLNVVVKEEFFPKKIGGIIVIDNETTSLSNNPAIISTSVIFYNLIEDKFDALTNLELLDKYKLNLAPSLTEQYFLNCDFDNGTQQWHLNQNKNYKESMSDKYIPVSVNDFFVKIDDFIRQAYSQISILEDFPSDVLIFCRRTHADWVWMDNLARKVGVKNPISYNNIFDVPSFISGARKARLDYMPSKEFKFKSHDAEGDVKRDIINILLAMQ